MSKERQLRWSKTARQSYLDILLDIQDIWGTERAIVFSERVEKLLGSIQRMPYQYPKAKLDQQEKSIRRCVVTKQTSLYYSVEDTYINILTFFNNRQDPDSLELL